MAMTKLLNRKDLSLVAELGLLTPEANKDNASRMADFILGCKLNVSSKCRKLSELRRLMRKANAPEEAINATKRPEITKGAAARQAAAPEKKVIIPREFDTPDLVVSRLMEASMNPDEAVKDPATVLDLYVATSARVSELKPDGLVMTPKARGRGIASIQVGGMLKKRTLGQVFPLVSIMTKTAKQRAAFMKLWRAWRSLAPDEVERMIILARSRAKHRYDGLRLKDFRDIGAELAVQTYKPDGTGLEKLTIRSAACRHAFDPEFVANRSVGILYDKCTRVGRTQEPDEGSAAGAAAS
jgi:hypothetical protein